MTAEQEKGTHWLWQLADDELRETRELLLETPVPVASRMPNRRTLHVDGPAPLLRCYVPDAPLIGPDTRVVAFGSCFAAHFSQWLLDHGFNKGLESELEKAIVRSPLESPPVVAQQFRWAFGELDSSLVYWQDADRGEVEATDERRALLRETLTRADVLVITLGLSEIWFDTVTGEPIWRIPPKRLRETGRYDWRVASLAETLESLETIDRIRKEHVPEQRVVYTVSPVPLTASFRPISPVVADTVSKAIIRAALDEFLRAREGELNRTYFYFPAYEIVTRLLLDPFDDHAHMHERSAAVVLSLFARHYTTATVDEIPLPESPEAELLQRLEARDQLIDVLTAERDAAHASLEAKKQEILAFEQHLRAAHEAIEVLDAMRQRALPYLRVRKAVGDMARALGLRR